MQFWPTQGRVIPDRIVCGHSDNALRRKLLQMSDLSLDTCMDVCRAAEATKNPSKGKTSHAYGDTKSEEINAVSKQNKFRSEAVTKPKDMLMDFMYCGLSHESLKERCPAFVDNCRSCGRTNHFIEKCTYKPGNTRATGKESKGGRTVNQVEPESSSEEELLSVTLHSVQESINSVSVTEQRHESYH